MKKNNFKVLRAGINSTFQDNGRHNLYHIGLPFSGAMDKRNYLIANSLVGNGNNDPVIEFAYQGPLLRVESGNINFSITGNVKFQIKDKLSKIIKGICYKTYLLSEGEEIDIISTNNSVYGYLAVSGGFDLEKNFGSYSTTTRAFVGPNKGKIISKDDKIYINNTKSKSLNKKLNYINNKIQYIRVIEGTNFNYFTNNSIKKFLTQEFTVSKLSDRMGMRLDGNQLKHLKETNIKSEGLIKGVIQVPADGNPIIMLSDHGTIGGYPKIAVVISADYDRLVQISQNSKIKFKLIKLNEAEKLYKLYKLETDNLINQIK